METSCASRGFDRRSRVCRVGPGQGRQSRAGHRCDQLGPVHDSRRRCQAGRRRHLPLKNYADSGYVGAWAYDTVNRRLRIWKQTGGVFCAQISDDGTSYVAIGGFSPAGGGDLNAGVTGTFTGGSSSPGSTASSIRAQAFGSHARLVRRELQHAVRVQGRLPVVDQLLQQRHSRWVRGVRGWLYDAGPSGTWLDRRTSRPARRRRCRAPDGALGR